eukprot:239931_1
MTEEIKEETSIDTMNKDNTNTFKIDWNHIIQCITHEMWPKLASVIKAMTNNSTDNLKIDVNDLSDKTVENVINILKDERYLPIEERQYLTKLIQRAKSFSVEYDSSYLSKSAENNEDYKDLQINTQKISQSLITDIFNVHRIFVFSNFNFREYTTKDYQTDIAAQSKKISGQDFAEANFNNISCCDGFNFYPSYLVHDDMFRIFDYHFGVSLFVNELKHSFHILSFVIPKSIKCIYDDKIEFNYGIDRLEEFLFRKKIWDFYKIRFDSDTSKNVEHIKQKILENYCVDDMQRNNSQTLVIVVDRRKLNGAHDLLYLFPCKNDNLNTVSELEANYFVGFDFKITENVGNNSNTMAAYFRYGLNERTRFYPEMLTSVIPRLFAKPKDLSPAELLDKIYGNSFKHGWCVMLYDELFETYYKMLTGFDHISVNYNRSILYHEFNDEKPMLCFMELFAHEIELCCIDPNDIKQIYEFIEENEYDTESLIDDILFEETEHMNA